MTPADDAPPASRDETGETADLCAFRGKTKLPPGLLSRPLRPLPTMSLDPAVKDLSAFKYEHFTLQGYEPHPPIKAEVAV